jgi:hypothetical protein
MTSNASLSRSINVERATSFRSDVIDGRFALETRFRARPWEVVVEPDEVEPLLMVVTAYPVEPAALLGTSGSHALHRAQPQLRACALPHGSVRTLRRCSSWNARCPSRYLRCESLLRTSRRSFSRGIRIENLLRRGRDSNPSRSVGNNLRRHVNLHTNARKFSSKCFGSLSPRVLVSRRESSGVGRGLGSGWAALHGIRRVRVEAQSRTWLRTSKSGPNGLR